MVNMECKMKFEYQEYNRKATNDELIDDVKRVAKEHGLSSLSMQEYNTYGCFDNSTIIRRFGTWNHALELAGLECRNRFYTELELFNNLQNAWIAKGCQPTRRDMDNKQYSTISSGAYMRKYVKWSNALKAFVEYINQDGSDDVFSKVNSETSGHKTTRDINLRLRFKVMQRDNFKCCACGTSPAKDPSVELHIDHIIPWSKGGETEIDNLQTLCSKCNLGKSDLT